MFTKQVLENLKKSLIKINDQYNRLEQLVKQAEENISASDIEKHQIKFYNCSIEDYISFSIRNQNVCLIFSIYQEEDNKENNLHDYTFVSKPIDGKIPIMECGSILIEENSFRLKNSENNNIVDSTEMIKRFVQVCEKYT